MRLRRSLVLPAVAATVAVSSAAAATHAKVFYTDTLPQSGAGQVTVTTHTAASFSILLRVPTQGRARLYLLGAKAPKGGPLLDVRPTAAQPAGCEGAAGSFYCHASYEPLPKGTYTWRIVWKGAIKAPIELTIRW